jgi:hypothetical protein
MTASQIQLRAIETHAYGYRFRSRLEARWAVFFTELGVSWEYEPQGFDVGGEPYLPDFKVVTGDLVYWYEVKPRNTRSCDKFRKFTELLGLHDDGNLPWNLEARLLSGDPYDVFGEYYVCPRCGRPESPEAFSNDEVGFLCHPCDMVTVSGGGNPAEIGFAGIPYRPSKGWIAIDTQDFNLLNEKIDKACLKARKARFEHGEQRW